MQEIGISIFALMTVAKLCDMLFSIGISLINPLVSRPNPQAEYSPL